MISVTTPSQQAVCSAGGYRQAPASVWFSGPDTNWVLVEEIVR